MGLLKKQLHTTILTNKRNQLHGNTNGTEKEHPSSREEENLHLEQVLQTT